jgi:hypothetical protein
MPTSTEPPSVPPLSHQYYNPPSPGLRASSIPLAAAASINASLQNEHSRSSSLPSMGSRQNCWDRLPTSASGHLNFLGRITTSPGNDTTIHPPNPHHERRRNSMLYNLRMEDPCLPGPGEIISSESPERQSNLLGWTPGGRYGVSSLGEKHQELVQEHEQEQEDMVVCISFFQLWTTLESIP